MILRSRRKKKCPKNEQTVAIFLLVVYRDVTSKSLLIITNKMSLITPSSKNSNKHDTVQNVVGDLSKSEPAASIT